MCSQDVGDESMMGVVGVVVIYKILYRNVT